MIAVLHGLLYQNLWRLVLFVLRRAQKMHSLFPLFLHTLPADSPLLGSLLDLLEDENK